MIIFETDLIYNRITPNTYNPSDRLPDAYIDDNYGDDVITITGKKGTVIFEDTNGFHKGTQIKNGSRYILQLQYCSTANF